MDGWGPHSKLPHILYYLVLYSDRFTSIRRYLLSNNLIGQYVFFLAIVIANCKILSISHSINLLQVVIMFLSFLSYLIAMWASSLIVSYMLYMILNQMVSELSFIPIIILTTITTQMFQLAMRRYLFLQVNKVSS